MSTIATSGRVCRTVVRSWAGSPALPTTSKPVSVSSRASPSRRRTSSSATTTRMAAPLGCGFPLRRVLDQQPAVERADAVLQIGQLLGWLLVRLDLDDQPSVGARRVDSGAPWPAPLQGLSDDEVGGGLNARFEALLWQPPQHQRAGGLFGQRLQRRPQALLGEGGRVKAVGKPTQLLERLANLCLGFLQGGDIGIGVSLEPGEPQREREGDQALLGAVVQVALQPPPFGVPLLDDPGA